MPPPTTIVAVSIGLAAALATSVVLGRIIRSGDSEPTDAACPVDQRVDGAEEQL